MLSDFSKYYLHLCMFKAETNHHFHQGHLAFGRLG